MAESSTERITTDLMDEPHIEGRRITVRNVHDWVEGRGLDPRTVADRFDLGVAEVYAALAYYHDHPSQMKSLREARKRALDDARERAESDRPSGVRPG
jgi:uncharacterized protein (DUF433 family)